MGAIADPGAKTIGIGELCRRGGSDTGRVGCFGSAPTDLAAKTRTRDKNDPSCECATHRAGARVVVVLIAEIAFFLRALLDLIPASRAQGTSDRLATHVETFLVEFSVVAVFDSQQDKSISASSFFAGFEAEAMIVVDGLAKIAFFTLAFLDKTIAAARFCAESGTESHITIVGSEIALFAALDDAISAEGLFSGVRGRAAA